MTRNVFDTADDRSAHVATVLEQNRRRLADFNASAGQHGTGPSQFLSSSEVDVCLQFNDYMARHGYPGAATVPDPSGVTRRGYPIAYAIDEDELFFNNPVHTYTRDSGDEEAAATCIGRLLYKLYDGHLAGDMGPVLICDDGLARVGRTGLGVPPWIKAVVGERGILHAFFNEDSPVTYRYGVFSRNLQKWLMREVDILVRGAPSLFIPGDEPDIV